MIRRMKTSLIILLLPILLLSGCWQAEPDPTENSELLQPEESEQLSTGDRVILPDLFALPYAPDLTLDPVTCADGMQQVVSSLLCEGLFRLGPDLEAEPYLCTSYTYDPETLTYAFELRSHVVFSDGTPLTSEDVKATLSRARTSERYGSRLAQVTSIQVDGSHVSITLAAPNSGFPALLDIPIVKQGTESAPVGTGPYLFSLEQSGAYLIANQSWWKGTQQPTNRIALIEAGDQETLLYRFTSHDVQLITADLIGTDPISATGSVAYQDANTTIMQYLGCNTARAPLDNTAFRKALDSGIDRNSLVSAQLSGHALPTGFPVSPASSLYPEELADRRDGSGLSAALAEVEYTADRTLTLLVNMENSFKLAAADQIAADFTAAGVPVTVKALPWDEYLTALTAGDFDLYYGEVKLTADWDLSSLLGTGGSLNYTAWSDPMTDQLMANLAAASDRETAMVRLCSRIQAQAPILPVCFKATSFLMQSDVLEGLTPTAAIPFYNLTQCRIHLREA